MEIPASRPSSPWHFSPAEAWNAARTATAYAGRPMASKAAKAVTNVHHSIDYVEITVKNVKKAKAFYAEAFGWVFNDYGDDYAGIQGPGREVGGITKGKTSKGGPLVLLYSSNLDKTLAAVKKAGGKIKDKPYKFPGGRRFTFADPSGNRLGVWASK